MPGVTRSPGSANRMAKLGKKVKRFWRDGRAAEGAPLLREYGFKKPIEGSNPSLSARRPSPRCCGGSGFMVALAGPPAAIRCEPRQARKGAAAAADSSAGVWRAGAATHGRGPVRRGRVSVAGLWTRIPFVERPAGLL